MKLDAIAWLSEDPRLCNPAFWVCLLCLCVCACVLLIHLCICYVCMLFVHLYLAATKTVNVILSSSCTACFIQYLLASMCFLANISVCMCCYGLSFTLPGYSLCPLAAPSSSPFTANPMSVIGSYMTECMQNAPAPLLSACVVLSCSLNTD